MPISGARTPGADSSALTPASAHTHRAPRRALLYAHHADLVLSGHVHAYERTHAVFDGCRDECGPIYLNLGDGGNREGAYVPWLTPQPECARAVASGFGVGGPARQGLLWSCDLRPTPPRALAPSPHRLPPSARAARPLLHAPPGGPPSAREPSARAC